MQLLWCMRERTNFDRGVLSLFLCLRKNYSEMKRNGQGQIKTCRRKQHVKTDGMKGILNLFCGIFAVGGNYNLTRDNVVITINRQQEAMHHRTIAVQRKALLEQVAQRKAIHMTHMMMAMMIYIWMEIMIMIGMTGIVIMPMVWMTQWMNLTRIGKYGR